MSGSSNSDTSIHQHCAILFADMVDYSSMREEDALQFKDEMMELAQRGLPERSGRIVKTLGDGFLAQFPNASGAVAFAIDLQDCVAKRNQGLPARRQFRLRVGIHAGEVVLRDGDVAGATVNIAATMSFLNPSSSRIA